jgi:monoamine oxidase
VGRTEKFRQLMRTLQRALVEERAFESTARIARRASSGPRPVTRREFVAIGGASAATLATPSLFAARRAAPGVGIVGAGLAGLVAAEQLTRRGIVPAVYEAADRVGGRCHSLRGFFPGQVAELGGEFIDNLHKTMLGYAKTFGLAREDVTKVPGEVTYFFDGGYVHESVIVEEFRAFVPAMRRDLQASSGAPTAETHNDADIALDQTTLAEYLVTRGASPLLRAVIEEAYLAEYGLEASEQSALNFLLFIHADRRSKFTPFGVFSDERFHLVHGNDGIATGLADTLAQPVELGLRLVAIRRRSDGRVELTFAEGSTTTTRTHDAVILAIPFTVLRGVALDGSLGLPAWKIDAISQLGYGTNAKMMLGFSSKPWEAIGSNGSSYSDLTNHQTTWETNPSRSSATRAVLTDYSGGTRGAGLNSLSVQQAATDFLIDLDLVFPGASAAATHVGGTYLAQMAHWPSNPLSLGSYTCYRPGQFTTIAGHEGTPVGNLFFAGEHTDSFYSWQGFMEGAALSGLAAAKAVRAL